MISTVWRKASTSKLPSASRYLSRLIEARLQAVLSRCMYSEHGLLPLIRPVVWAVCQRLIVVSNCRPGSAHSHAAWAIWRHRSRALTVRSTSPVVTATRPQSASSATACMNSSVTRTELLAFWYWIENESDAVEVHVEAVVAQDARLALLLDLAPDELLDVGVVDVEDDHLGRPAGLAARLDRARRGVGAAHEADRARRRAAALQQLGAGADPGQVDARAGAALEDDALFAVPVEDRVHRVVDGEDEAGRGLLGHARDADVEPHRAVERRPLGDEDVLQLVVERLGLVVVDEVAALPAPRRDRVDDPVDDLAQRRLPLRRAERAPEVLLGDDVGGVDRPGHRELDAELLEGDRAVLPVA